MNYRRSRTAEDLWRLATRDVQSEWLAGTTFANELRLSLDFLWAAAEHINCDFVPRPENLLEPMKWLKPSQVRVIITAQDPYPNPKHATGIAFHSLASPCPFSARRINQNLIKYGHISGKFSDSADYRSWLRQGVLLTNVSLTTKASAPWGQSPGNLIGNYSASWKNVMKHAFQLVPKESVALLLGQDARSIMATLGSIFKVEHVHPASRNDEFIEKDIFKEVNDCLAALKLRPIDWTPGS